jgi:hypothetical protein
MRTRQQSLGCYFTHECVKDLNNLHYPYKCPFRRIAKRVKRTTSNEEKLRPRKTDCKKWKKALANGFADLSLTKLPPFE